MNYLLYKYKISKLYSSRDKIIEVFKLEYKKVSNKDPHSDEILSLHSEEQTELDIIDFEIETLITRYYSEIANKYFVSIEPYGNNEYWRDSCLYPSKKVMSNKAIRQIRKTLIEERKIKIEQITQIIIALTGLIGVLIGFLAVLKN